jgi:two-component system, OmpR family, response regulator
MRILLLEDDEDLGPWVQNGLKENGHVVDLLADGKDALITATMQSYDLFIFDRMVPTLDGLSLLQSLRASKNQTPVIFLTALGEVDERVQGLENGADDYLVKPFEFAELLARIDVMARRHGATAQTQLTVLTAGDLVLDLVARQCRRNMQIIDLTAKEFQLLEYFMRRPNRLVTRTMLLEQVWEMSFDPTTSIVETHLSRLRNKIDKPFGAQSIKSRRGEGYVFQG